MVSNQEDPQIVVDATNCIAGRMCSKVSKLLLSGKRVSIVNAEKAMLSGDKYMTIRQYKEHLEINSVTNPIHGPFHPRRPDTILTKMVRGMIPYRKPGGLKAFKHLRVYIGIPKELSSKEKQSFDDVKITKNPSYYVTIADISKQIGWKALEGENTV